MTALSPIPDEKNMAYGSQPVAVSMYRMEGGGWHTPPTVEGHLNRTHSLATGLALLGVDEASREHYGANVPWTPPTDYSAAPYNDMAMATAHVPGHHGRSSSMDVAMSAHLTSAWVDTTAHDMMSYGTPSSIPTPASMASTYFPSPSTTPNLRPPVSRHKASSGGNSSSCTCFTVCLQSLQALHNASSPACPPFDIVLQLNRKAVEGCAAMLACPRCMSRSGTHTAAMLLATVIGKITSFYKNASQAYFENGGGTPSTVASHHNSPGTGLGVSLGAYTLGGEEGRWLELEILARELRKLEEVYAQFREVCADLSEDPEVSRAMIGYLSQNLGSTLEVVSHRKGDMGYA
jgi:hypothetical protein